MKKYAIIVLSLILLIVFVGCGEKYSFMAVVTEVTDTTMLVRPVEGSSELKSADQIEIALHAVTDKSQPQAGDTYKIVYNGNVLETNPARVAKIKSVTLVSEKKLSAEALKEMRERYPYCRTNASAATLPEEFWAKGNDVFFVAELTEGKRETTETMVPNPDLDPALATDVTTYYFPARILEIIDIRDGCSLTEEDIVLSFPGLFYDSDIAFDKGQRIVVFGTFEESEESGKTQLGIGAIMSFYLTDDNYVLSLSSHAQMDQFSGMKLDAFKKEMLRITEVGGWHPR